MNNIKIIKKILEKEIIKLNNAIVQIKSTSSIDEYLKKINEEDIWNLKQDELNKLITELNGKNILTEEEIRFLEFIVKMPEELKTTQKDIFGLDEMQKSIINSVRKKIENYKQEFNEEDIKEIGKVLYSYKVLLNKFKQNDMNLIFEIDIISKLLKENNISFIEQLQIMQEINAINSNIFKKYNIVIEEKEEILSEEDLEETNLEEEKLKILFEEFEIDWNKLKDENKDKNQKIDEYYKKLLKHGKYDSMREKLMFLKSNDLTFVFDLPEILTKVLLFSTVSKMQELLDNAAKYNIDYYDMIKSKPALLFPTIMDRKAKFGTGGESNPTTSGLLNNFLNCVQFFEKKDYPVDIIFEECPSVFYNNEKTIKKVHDRLELYGIGFRNPDGSLKKGFSVLGTLDIQDKIDIGIETGCYEYYKDNISKLVDTSLNLYRVKLARSKGLKDDEIFRTYTTNTKKYLLRSAFWDKTIQQFGTTPKDTFELYNAYKEETELTQVLDDILANNENDKITDIVLNFNIIQELDKLYKKTDDDKIYNFNGIIISRLKVLRYCETFISNPEITMSQEVLLFAVTRNSMLNESEYKIVKECVEKVMSKRRNLS